MYSYIKCISITLLTFVMETYSVSDLDIFIKPARILISGFSNSGKTYLVTELIKKYTCKFNQIKVCGIPSIDFQDRKLSYCESTYDPLQDDTIDGEVLVVYDDSMLDDHCLKIAATLFSKGRHKSISTIFITQNLFIPSKYYRVISLNASHVIIFKIRDISQISYFGRTFLDSTHYKKFLDVYRKYVTNKEYGYLLIDFTKSSASKLFIRFNITANNIDNYERCIVL